MKVGIFQFNPIWEHPVDNILRINDFLSDSIQDEDIIIFTNANGEMVQAVELRTEDTMYLVKISKSLSNFISNFEDAIERELDSKDPDLVQEPEIELNLDQEQEEEKDID